MEWNTGVDLHVPGYVAYNLFISIVSGGSSCKWPLFCGQRGHSRKGSIILSTGWSGWAKVNGCYFVDSVAIQTLLWPFAKGYASSSPHLLPTTTTVLAFTSPYMLTDVVENDWLKHDKRTEAKWINQPINKQEQVVDVLNKQPSH